MPRSNPKLPTCRSIYLGYVDEYLRELGEDSELVFRAAGIDDLAATLNQPRIPVDLFGKVYSRVYQNPRLPGFFVELGKRIPVTAHGNLGIAFLVSANLGAMLSTLERFTEIALPVVHIATVRTELTATINLSVSVTCPHFKAALLESITSHLLSTVSNLTASKVRALDLSFQHTASASAPALKALVDGRVTFNAPHNTLKLPARLLDEPVKTANKLNEQLLIKQCADELASLHSNTGLASRVRELLALNMSAKPGAKMIAGKLSLSERSLRRYLSLEGLSFRDMLKDVRHELACHYLSNTKMPIKYIAEQLSYSETASFSQSFRAMTGVSPKTWRDKASGSQA